MKKWKTPKVKRLARAMLSIKNEKDMANFLRDLCTLDELREISNRWEVVHLLELGMSYREISKKTGLSTTTVSRISHWLHHGEGGYEVALKKETKKKRP